MMKDDHADGFSLQAAGRAYALRRERGPNIFPRAVWAGLLLAGMVSSCPVILAQSPERQKLDESGAEKNRKTYTVRNGSVTYGRVEESERRLTPEGTIEKERVRMPSWDGDRRVLMEREIRTKKLADGTVEKEYVLKNPDGAEHLVPVEIIHERIKKNGDSTTVEREVLKPDIEGHWKALRKETLRETGPEAAKQKVREVRVPTIAGGWQVVDREVTRQTSSQDAKELHSVRQLPDAYGRLADYEVRQERTATEKGRETHAVTLLRRDFQDTDHSKFYLVERTVSERHKSADGKVTFNSTTESDLLAGGATRNAASGRPQPVEARSVEEVPGQARRTMVKESGVADPRLRPSYQVIEETDREGHVRQVFIPLR